MVTFGISPECLCHDVRENVRRVRALEEAGFDYIWEGDHTLPWQHSTGHSAGIFTTLEAFLSTTERAVVGGMVLPALGIRHHPIDVAIEVATQALLHPGRVALCVGTGEAMNEKTTTGYWPSLRERIERTIEGIELIRKAWQSDDYFTHRGKHFRSFFYLYTKPEQPIPLLCASQGPIMARNAGLHSDGYVAVGVPPSHHRDVLIPAFEEGAREAGKDPANLMKCAWVSTFYHPNTERALAAAGAYGGLLIPECYHHIQDPRIIEQRASLISEDALRGAFCIATSGDEIAQVFEHFIDAGCNHIIWADGSPDPTLVAAVCADEVLPTLRKRQAASPPPSINGRT
ncbi:MAG: LLM class flavin-dependent oxidoreductase [Gaiellales bacterium]